MNSFALWYEKAPEVQGELAATVHFNLFNGCEWKDEPFLDVGLLLENISVAENLYFFIPIDISSTEKESVLEDLGDKLRTDEVLDAVFNDSYIIQTTAGKKYFCAENCYDPNDNFMVYCLDIKKDLQLESFESSNAGKGTIISIITSKIGSSLPDKESKCYLRFRIKNDPLSFLIHKYSSPNWGLQSVFQATYMVDFRFNNTRSIPKSLIEQMHAGNNCIVPVKALHFLLITKAHVSVDGTTFFRVRTIEDGVWQNYVRNSGNTGSHDIKDLVAYHYVDDNKDGAAEKNGMYPSELFVKFHIEKSVVLWYILLTIIMEHLDLWLLP